MFLDFLYENFMLVSWQEWLKYVVMWLIGAVLIFLAIRKEMEPTLLLPLGLGTILVNMPFSGAIEPLEEVIDDMVFLLKNRHTNRLCQGVCVISSGLVFMDALTHLERVADQCSNLAMLVMGRRNQEILKENHRYLQELHEGGDQSYRAEHKMRRAQYLAALDSVEG